MNQTINLTTLCVFANEKGGYGNPVGIVVDNNQSIQPIERQHITANTGFSECVFIDNMETGKVSIYNPIREVAFAGHALVGTAFYLHQIVNSNVSSIMCKGGQIDTHFDNELTWIRAKLAGTPAWNHIQMKDASTVENLTNEQITSFEHTIVWAWIDESKGIIRARTLAPDWGIPEDEANGSGAMQLAANTKKTIEIHHGKGSVIYAHPINENVVEVGGNVNQHSTEELNI